MGHGSIKRVRWSGLYSLIGSDCFTGRWFREDLVLGRRERAKALRERGGCILWTECWFRQGGSRPTTRCCSTFLISGLSEGHIMLWLG